MTSLLMGQRQLREHTHTPTYTPSLPVDRAPAMKTLPSTLTALHSPTWVTGRRVAAADGRKIKLKRLILNLADVACVVGLEQRR